MSSEELDNFIRKNIELKICADLCNGQKHCVLKQKRMWTNSQPHIAGKRFISSGTNNIIHKIEGVFTISTDGKFYDALELAEKCMKLWDEFVEELKKRANK